MIAIVLAILLGVVIIFYLTTPKAQYVAVGITDGLIAPKPKRISMRSTFQVDKCYINPKKYFVGIVYDNFAIIAGFKKGSIFFAERCFEKPEAGNIFVLKTRDNYLILREIMNIQPDGGVQTRIFNDDTLGAKFESYEMEDLLAKVVYVVAT